MTQLFNLEDKVQIERDIAKANHTLVYQFGLTEDEQYIIYGNIERIYDATLKYVKIPEIAHGLTMLYIAHTCYQSLEGIALTEQAKKPDKKLKIYPQILTDDEIKCQYYEIFGKHNEQSGQK